MGMCLLSDSPSSLAADNAGSLPYLPGYSPQGLLQRQHQHPQHLQHHQQAPQQHHHHHQQPPLTPTYHRATGQFKQNIF